MFLIPLNATPPGKTMPEEVLRLGLSPFRRLTIPFYGLLVVLRNAQPLGITMAKKTLRLGKAL